MKRAVSLILIVFAIFSIMTACQNGSSKTAEKGKTTQAAGTVGKTVYPLSYKDSTGTTVVFEKAPAKAVSISPSITEIIYALGADSKLAARTNWCKYPEDVKNKKTIGDIMSPNMEAIAEIDPDVVLISGMNNDESVKKIKELGFKVVILSNEEGFDATYQLINDLGSIFDASAKASTIVADMKEKVESVKAKVLGKKKPTVYYVVAFGKSDYTATGETFISSMIEIAGGVNVAADAKGWKYSLEKLIENNPQYIICANEFNQKEGLQTTTGYKDLEAVKAGRVFEVNKDIFEIQGPRLVDGLVVLSEILHGK